MSNASPSTWGDQPDDSASAGSPKPDIGVTRAARRPLRLFPALFGLLLGLTIAGLNLWVVLGDLRLRVNGADVTFTVTGCQQGGRSRTCEGSYVLNGRPYDNRLLLGGEGAHVGQTVNALVDRKNPGDASTTGVAAPIEATLFVLGGVFIAVLAGRRGVVAQRSGRGRPHEPRSRRSFRSRARVWEGAPLADEDSEPAERPEQTGLPDG